MKLNNIPLVFSLCLFAFNVSLFGQDDAKEIYTRATGQLFSGDMELLLEIDTKDKKGRIKEKSFEILKASFGDVEKTKMSWQKPEAAKGTTVIFTENPGETGLIEVFTPSNGKTRKLKATDENMKMVGSEAQIMNITERNTDELSFTHLPALELEGKQCYNIKVKNADSDDNARGELVIEMDSYRIVQITVYDKGGQKSSFVKLSDYQEVEGPENRILPMRIITEDFENRKQTDMRVLKSVARTDLSEADFQLPVEQM